MGFTIWHNQAVGFLANLGKEAATVKSTLSAMKEAISERVAELEEEEARDKIDEREEAIQNFLDAVCDDGKGIQ